jgi:hypothetical protein
MRIRHPSRRGAAMSPVRWSTGATCRGRPRRRRPVVLKCRRRAGHERRSVIRLWARALVRRPPTQVGQRSVRSCTALSETGTPGPLRPVPRQADPPRRSEERSVSVCQLYDGSDRLDSDSLLRRRSRGRSSDSTSMPSAPPTAEPSAAPRRLQSLLIWGGRAPDVHLPLVAGGGHGPNPTIAEAGGTALEQMGENVATVEAAGRSGQAPETTGSRCVIPE